MKFKAMTVLFGAVAASSLSMPTKFGGPADAADVVSQKRPEMVKVPEFVPVINFSQFVLAMQTFAAENPTAARAAAEALSAKFASSDGSSQQIEIHKPIPQVAAQLAKPAPIIVTRPVEVASIPDSGISDSGASAIPAVPDPTGRPQAVSDPVKIITGYPKKRAEAKPHRHKAEKQIASASRERIGKRFQPAMGLGMVIDSAENAPPISSLAQKKRTVKYTSRDIE